MAAGLHVGPGHEVVVFQPQIDAWPDYERIEARAAFAVTMRGAGEPVYDALSLTASSEVDFSTRTVLVEDRQVQEVRFPNAAPSQMRQLTAAVNDALPPRRQLRVSLDLVLANVERTKQRTREVEVNLEPPPIFYSERPAILVMFMDQPRFEEIDGTTLLFATNTNWDVFLDSRTGKYFLRDGLEWMTAPDPLEGPWGRAAILPLDITRLPETEDWTEVRKAVPGKAPGVMPVVFTTTRPAELVQTDGPPSLSSIRRTRVLYVTNTDSDLFLLTGADAGYYLLTAGRWFRATKLEGAWSAATRELPEDFAKIPDGHVKAHALASVPGTPAAEEAVLQASIPRKVTVERDSATVIVQYDGDPEFVLVEDTTVHYAVNSPYDVFRVEGAYYCCYQGVWFVAPSPRGPWTVTAEVPAAIYTIPATHQTQRDLRLRLRLDAPDRRRLHDGLCRRVPVLRRGHVRRRLVALARPLPPLLPPLLPLPSALLLVRLPRSLRPSLRQVLPRRLRVRAARRRGARCRVRPVDRDLPARRLRVWPRGQPLGGERLQSAHGRPRRAYRRQRPVRLVESWRRDARRRMGPRRPVRPTARRRSGASRPRAGRRASDAPGPTETPAPSRRARATYTSARTGISTSARTGSGRSAARTAGRTSTASGRRTDRLARIARHRARIAPPAPGPALARAATRAPRRAPAQAWAAGRPVARARAAASTATPVPASAGTATRRGSTRSAAARRAGARSAGGPVVGDRAAGAAVAGAAVAEAPVDLGSGIDEVESDGEQVLLSVTKSW